MSTVIFFFFFFQGTRYLPVHLGPAIGFGVTTLALCDVVYSVPEATFNTPFMKLAFCAEGCSSILFPRIMGATKANEMLVTINIFFFHAKF